KYIHSSDGHHELYDLAADPREARNLIDKRPDLATALARELVRRLEAGPGALPVEPLPPLTEEEIRRLKALGYL
ncbi:MAG: sulfatase, partial [Acidobacteriota bacterium]|nr:sulfatase [Acidobacteriota bacterium]